MCYWQEFGSQLTSPWMGGEGGQVSAGRWREAAGMRVSGAGKGRPELVGLFPGRLQEAYASSSPPVHPTL